MSSAAKPTKRVRIIKDYRPLTVGDAEKASGISYDAPSEWTLVEYFERRSAKPLGDLLKEAQSHLIR